MDCQTREKGENICYSATLTCLTKILRHRKSVCRRKGRPHRLARREEPQEDPPGERHDGRHRLLLPGFYNVHSHAPMTLLRGYAENLPLQRWLGEKVFPVRGPAR